MNKKADEDTSKLISRITALVLGLPWIEILADAYRLGKKIIRGLTSEGMYEVLEYESVLELHNSEGTKATFKKRKKIRYLQDNVIAYQDYGWGDGKFLKNYQTSPGVPVDQYKSGFRTYVLLSLRDIKNKGDEDEFHIQWDIEEGFLKPDGFWETDVSNRTKHMKISVIFPADRPPLKVKFMESNVRKTRSLNGQAKKKLSDGRWKVTWEIGKPRLYEHYVLRWDW